MKFCSHMKVSIGSYTHHVCMANYFSYLFTCVGAYIFKAYTNGHPYDTSQVILAVTMLSVTDHTQIASYVCTYIYVFSKYINP